MKHPYLENKKIKIIATPAGNRWTGGEGANKYSKVQPGAEASMKMAPFVFPDAIKGYCIPDAGGRINPFLDSTQKKECPDLVDTSGKPMKLTEQEYFEKILGLNLNPFGKDSDWFKTSLEGGGGVKPTYLQITNGELSLDLSNPSDMLRYKIALQKPEKIAKSKEIYNFEKRDSQLFMIVDDIQSNEEQVNLIKSKAEASALYLKLSGNRKAMLIYFASKGVMLADNIATKDIETKFALDYDRDPVEFLKFAQDPDADVKYVILKARMLGLIEGNTKTNKYTTPSFSGKLQDLVYHYRNSENSEELRNLEIQIEK